MNSLSLTRALLSLALVSTATGLAADAPNRVTASPAVSVVAIESIPSSRHPVIACTPEELERLRSDFARDGTDGVVATRVRDATRRIAQPVEYPPRGGQHNQWYQCSDCQIGLRTIDVTRHECPRCRKIYLGAPYDDVLFSRTHSRNLGAMTDAAWAYAITGDEKFAAFARQILLGYAKRYGAYAYHDSRLKTGREASRSGGHLFEQTLNEAMAMTRNFAPAVDLIRASTSLSLVDRETIQTQLLVPMLENIAKHKAGKSNWQTWHNAAMISGGAVLGETAWVRRAIEDPEHGFRHQMQISVSDEGMWYENSWGYHFYTLGALVSTAEVARRIGIDLWTHPVLRKMFFLPVAYAMPDGSLPRFGDDVGTSLARAAPLLEYAYHAYRDEALRPFLSGTPDWESVTFGRKVERIDLKPPVQSENNIHRARLAPQRPSELFPSAGHAILRTDGEAGLTAALTFGPYGGGHGHYDKLSFVLYGHGRELGVDPGRARSQAYRLPIHQHWYKATISHNAVVVDRAPQQPATGKLESFGATTSWAAVVARCDAAYPGVTHRRAICVTPSYILVFDDLASSSQRRFDWLYHSRGSSATSEAAQQKGASEDSYPGWNYVENVLSGATDGTIRVRYPDGEVTTHLTIAAAGATEVRTGDGVGASVLERVPLAMVTRHGAQARFAATLEPVNGVGPPSITSVECAPAGSQTRITVHRGSARDVFLLDASGMLNVSSGGKQMLQTAAPAVR